MVPGAGIEVTGKYAFVRDLCVIYLAFYSGNPALLYVPIEDAEWLNQAHVQGMLAAWRSHLWHGGGCTDTYRTSHLLLINR